MTKRLPERFLPGPPLVAFVTNRYDIPAAETGDLSVVMQVAPRTITRWREGGTMRLEDGQRHADRLGVHPTAIWSDWWDWVLDDDTPDD